MSKKISSNQISKFIKYNEKKETDIQLETKDKPITVKVNPHISLNEYGEIVIGICDELFDKDGNFLPYLYDVIFGKYILGYFTNIDVEKLTSVQLWDLITYTDIINKVKDCLNENTVYIVESLELHIAELINQRENLKCNTSKYDVLLDSIVQLVQKAVVFADNFNGINIENTNEIINLLSQLKNIDENKIVQAVFNQSPNIKENINKE